MVVAMLLIPMPLGAQIGSLDLKHQDMLPQNTTFEPGHGLILLSPQGNGFGQTPAPTDVFSDTVTMDGRVEPLNLPEMLGEVWSASVGPTMAQVTLNIRDMNGNPVRNACVRAVSDDWGVIMPSRWDWNCANTSGIVVMSLPVGRWSFYAVAPGYFVPLRRQTIVSNTNLSLRATTSMNIEVRDFDGRLMSDVKVYVVDPERKPTVPPMEVGNTSSGVLRVVTVTGVTAELLLLRYPPAGTSDGTAYFVHAGIVTSGGTLRYRFIREQLALIRFNLINPSGYPSEKASLGVQYPTISWDWDFGVWFSRGWGSWWNSLQLWVSPLPIEMQAHDHTNDWSLGFAPVVLQPQAGESYELTFGGPLKIHTWFYPLLDDGRQVSIQVQDSYGHRLVFVSSPDGAFSCPIYLLDEQGNVVYQGVLDHPNLTGRLEVEPAGLRYRVNLDLGFFGQYTLEGIALDSTSTWPVERLETPHFIIFWPQAMHDQAEQIMTFAEQSYQATASILGHTTTSGHEHGKIEVHFPFYCNCAGWAGGSTFAVMEEYLSYGGLLAPWQRGVVSAIWSHELAHVFQGTGPGLEDYYIAGWFGEPFASFVGGLALEEIFGGNVGIDWLVRDLENLYFWKLSSSGDLMGTACYVINAVRRFYTMLAHQKWVQFWAGTEYPNRQCITPLGLADMDNIAIAYSYVVQDNLGWLFREARYNISDAVISTGQEAIQACRPPAFTDVTALAGARGRGGFHGVAWGDYDNDGDLDIYATSFSDNDLLFRNNGDGTFTDVTQLAGIINPGHGRAAIWGDYDNDGWMDLYVTREGGYPAELWHNNRDGTFANFAEIAGVNTDSGMSAAWGDYDRDGFIDILVVRWCGMPRLYHNERNGRFVDVAESSGLTRAGCGVGAMFGDYDRDGDLDIFYSLAGQANALYRNEGDGRFTDVTYATGLVGNFQGGAAAWGDYDNDGDLDLLQSGDQTRCWLYQNLGDGSFTEVGDLVGIQGNLIGRGVAWADYDNDGWLDFAWLGWDGFRIFRNNRDGTFSDVTGAAGVDPDWGGNGLAWGDYDGDGDLDLYNTGWWGNTLYRNNSHGNWLTVKLVGQRSNRTAIGAWVSIEAPTGTQFREISGGSGYHGQDSLPVEFGLGDSTQPVSIVIHWPRGFQQRLENVAVNQHLVVEESLSLVELPMVLR